MRTKFDANEIVIKKNCAEIVLYNVANEEKARAVIDLDCVDLISGVKWYLRSDGYVATNNYRGSGYRYLHSILLNKNDSNIYVDHKDGNRLNNHMNNLRIVTPAQSGMNRGIGSNNTSGRVGVHFSKQNGKWCSMICYNKKHINLGYSDSYEEAVKLREDAEKRYFGAYRPDSSRTTKNKNGV